jgi:hypothetical protein
MAVTITDILTAFRHGEISAEDAARQLIPLLQTSGRLSFPITQDLRPLLEAIRRMAGQAPRPKQPLSWESPHWKRLDRVAEDFWTILRDRRMEQEPQCLRYAFSVGTAAAATALEDWLMDHSDHAISVDLPYSFESGLGQVVGVLPAKRLQKSDLEAWVTWLRGIPPVADAALSDLGIVSPPLADS